MDEREALVALNAVEGIGNARIKKLIEFYGNAKKVFSVRKNSLIGDSIIPSKAAGNILDFPKDKFIKSEYNLVNKNKVKISGCN